MSDTARDGSFLSPPRSNRNVRLLLISAFVACLVFVHASRNRWALDDEPIIETNLATHSIGAATRAFFSPYWPPQTGSGGLYRPAVILSYGLDWSLSGGNPDSRRYWRESIVEVERLGFCDQCVGSFGSLPRVNYGSV